MKKKNTITYKEWFIKRSDAIRYSLIKRANLDGEDFQFISNRLVAKYCGEFYDDKSQKLEDINELINAIKAIFNSFDLSNYSEIKEIKQKTTELLNKKFKFNMLYLNEINGYRDKLENRHAILDKYLIGYDFVCLDAKARDFIIAEAKKIKKQEDLQESEFVKLSFMQKMVLRLRKNHKQAENVNYKDVSVVEIQ